MAQRIMELSWDVSAYATLPLPDSVPLDDEALREYALSVEGDAQFEVDWGTEKSLRITSITEEVEVQPFTQGSRYLRQEVPLLPMYHDAGQQLELLLKGSATLTDLVNDAAARMLIPPIEEVRHTGTLRLPMSESIDVEFYARKGASQVELDAAFLAAFAQVGQISYEEVGGGQD